VDVQLETPMGLAVQQVQTPAIGEAIAQFTVLPIKPGEFRVRVALNEDALESDNALEAVFAVQEPLQVALVTSGAHDPASSAMYLAAATEAIVGRPPVVLSPDKLSKASLDPFDVVIISSSAAMESDELSAMRSAAEQGAGLIWLIDSDAAIESLQRAANDDWAPAVPISDGMVRHDNLAMDRIDIARFFGRARDSANDGLFDLLGKATFATVSEVKLQNSAHALLSLSNGSPLVTARDLGTGRVLTVHAPLSSAHTVFSTSAAFPVFVSALLEHATSTATGTFAQRDPAESDLHKLAPTRAGPRNVKSSNAAEHPAAGRMIELWPVFIGAALLLVLVDTVLGAGVIGRRSRQVERVSL